MTPFTDDDLKRLKEWCNLPKNVLTQRRKAILNLIDRLEAAEAVCNTQEHTCCRQIPIICRACVNYEAWRKAAGK